MTLLSGSRKSFNEGNSLNRKSSVKKADSTPHEVESAFFESPLYVLFDTLAHNKEE